MRRALLLCFLLSAFSFGQASPRHPTIYGPGGAAIAEQFKIGDANSFYGVFDVSWPAEGCDIAIDGTWQGGSYRFLFRSAPQGIENQVSYYCRTFWNDSFVTPYLGWIAGINYDHHSAGYAPLDGYDPTGQPYTLQTIAFLDYTSNADRSGHARVTVDITRFAAAGSGARIRKD